MFRFAPKIKECLAPFDMREYKTISVIIPTLDRKDKLITSLRYYNQQTLPPKNFEIIIIDDGSKVPVKNYLTLRKYQFNIRVFRQENAGPAKARNLGIRKAKKDIILFAGDDMVPTRDFLEKHLQAHNKKTSSKIAILGCIKWYPKLMITPLMYYVTELSKKQFGYSLLKDQSSVGWKYFYSSNISLKRNFLAKTREYFCEKFTKAAFEDIEFGYRLCNKHRLAVIYSADTVAYHNHAMNFSYFYKKKFDAGQMAMIFFNEHKEAIPWPVRKEIPICKTLPKEFASLHKILKAMQVNNHSKGLKDFFSRMEFNLFLEALAFAYSSGANYYLRNHLR